MTSKIILTTALTLLLAGICSGEQLTDTRSDAGGSPFQAGYPKTAGAEEREIVLIAAYQQEKVPAAQQQGKTPEQGTAPSRLETEAAALRKEEADLRQQAANLTAEVEELRRLAKKHHYKERYQRRAGIKEREAEELVKQADALASQAEALERRASELK